MRFAKMHGLGNDFIVVTGPVEVDQMTIARLCDRHTGIGADGFIIVTKLGAKKLKMEYWNADGTDAEMCGNGLRCVIRYAVAEELVKPGDIVVETPVGPLHAIWDGKRSHSIEVQVGKVVNDDTTVKIEGYEFHTASIGNPHAIAYVDDLDAIDIEEIGPRIELDEAFPQKTNVEFVEASDDELRIGIWERGSGLTLACGTGMSTCAVVSNDLGKVELPVTVTVPGGSAQVWVDDEGYTRMKGPARTVYRGEIDI